MKKHEMKREESKGKRPITMKEYEKSPEDKKADRRELREVNKKRGKK